MIKDTILKLLKLDGLVNTLTGYVETRLELLKYEIKEDIARAIAHATIFIIVALLVGLIVLFISVTGALKIGEYLGMTLGFAIVGGFYLVISILIIASRKSLSKKIEAEIKKHFKKKENGTGN